MEDTQKNSSEMLALFYYELLEIFNLKMELKHGEMQARLDAASLRLLNLERVALEQMEYSVLALFLDEHFPENRLARYLIASHLLKEQADLYTYKTEFATARMLYFSSLKFFLSVHEMEPDFQFSYHLAILPELTNRLPAGLITEEMSRQIEEIFDSAS